MLGRGSIKQSQSNPATLTIIKVPQPEASESKETKVQINDANNAKNLIRRLRRQPMWVKITEAVVCGLVLNTVAIIVGAPRPLINAADFMAVAVWCAGIRNITQGVLATKIRRFRALRRGRRVGAIIMVTAACWSVLAWLGVPRNIIEGAVFLALAVWLLVGGVQGINLTDRIERAFTEQRTSRRIASGLFLYAAIYTGLGALAAIILVVTVVLFLFVAFQRRGTDGGSGNGASNGAGIGTGSSDNGTDNGNGNDNEASTGTGSGTD